MCSLGQTCHIRKLEKVAIELPTLEVLTTLFFRGLELPTLAVLWPRCRTADLGSSMASFQHFRTFRHRTADLGSSMAAFQHFAQSLILKMS